MNFSKENREKVGNIGCYSLILGFGVFMFTAIRGVKQVSILKNGYVWAGVFVVLGVVLWAIVRFALTPREERIQEAEEKARLGEEKARADEQHRKEIEVGKNYVFTKEFTVGSHKIKINEEEKTWKVFMERWETASVEREYYLKRTFSFSDVMGVDVIEDGASISKTKTTSVITRSMVGSLFGPVGTVIGGTTAKKKSVDGISRLELVIYVKDLERPTISLPLITQITKKDSSIYRAISREVSEVSGAFKIMKEQGEAT